MTDPLYALGDRRWRLADPTHRLTADAPNFATTIVLDGPWTAETPWLAIAWGDDQVELVKMSGLPRGPAVPVIRGMDGGPVLSHHAGSEVFAAWPEGNA